MLLVQAYWFQIFFQLGTWVDIKEPVSAKSVLQYQKRLMKIQKRGYIFYYSIYYLFEKLFENISFYPDTFEALPPKSFKYKYIVLKLTALKSKIQHYLKYFKIPMFIGVEPLDP